MGKTFVSLIVVFLIVGGLMVFQATRSSASSVVHPSDIAAALEKDMPRIRIAGRVASEGVDYQVEPKIVLRFFVEDPPSDQAKGGKVPVVYEGLKPDMFAPGRDVLIDGDFKDGVLVASQLLTQCPSKYEPPSPEDVAKAQNH